MQIWLTIFVSWPAPGAAHQRHRARVVREHALRRARTTSASPPTMIVSLPFSAPAWPPDTGASRKPTPRAFAAACTSRATSRRRGRVIDQDRCPRAIAGERAVGAQRDGAHVVVVADAHHHELGAARPPPPASARVVPPYFATHCAAFAGVRL